MLLMSWRGILIGIVSESVKSLYRPLFWRIWRLLGIRPLTNLLFKRYTVILIDTPTLPKTNKTPPPPRIKYKQTNESKIQGIYLKLTCEMPTCYYLLVYMYVWEGGGGNKAYTLRKLISTHIFILKLWFLRKQQRKTSNYEVINLWIHWIITNINYIIGGNDLPSYIWQVCPHLSESCFLLVHLMYWEAERGATEQTAPLF